MMMGASGGIDVFADYDPVGSATHRVQVYNGSTLVADFPNHRGQVATVGQFPDSIEKQGSNGGPGGTECMYPCWSEPTSIIVDGQTFEGDTLAVLIENPTMALGDLDGFSIRGRDLVLRLTSESTTSSDVTFKRGDANGDGGFDIGDAIFLLAALFSGGDPCACDDACDANDDGSTNIADAIYMLTNLFSGGAAPPAPGPNSCGIDPTSDALDCDEYSGC
jgi:hypothetical protein